MSGYSMPVLSEQERDFLVNMAKIEIRRWGNLADQQRGGYMADLMKIALASLTATPVAYEVKGLLCHTLDEAEIYVGDPEPLYDAPPVPVKQEGEQ